MRQRTMFVVGGIALVLGLALGLAGSMLLGENASDVRNANLRAGDKAPEFELYDHTGTKVWLSDFRGTKNVVLAFYPAAWTPV